jgi:ABC-type bacteriocin/lantibiotic exporter with double-glycine peptidase domain
MDEKINAIQFVGLFTLLMVFKERMNTVANLSSDIIEQYGKLEAVMEPFNDFDARVLNINKNYSKIDLDFNHIELKNVTFKYGEGFDYVMQDKNLTIDTSNHKIIGITGESGKGKSTITKLLLKMYIPEKGSIFIDDVDIQ